MASRVRVRGIEAEGRHGANPAERDEPQPFVVDVELSVEVAEDALHGTIDYEVVATAVRDVVTGGSFVLLETLAEAVARAVRALPQVERATAVVHKPRAAALLGVDDVAAEATVA